MVTLADLLRTGYTPPMDNQPLAQVLKDQVAQIPQNIVHGNEVVQNAYPYDGQGGLNPNFSQDAQNEFNNNMVNFMGATAWHGTPHEIKGGFDINKVGTGEGAQAYGHGMYFAENPTVAESYKTALSNPEVVLQNGKRITSPAVGTPEDVAKAWLEEAFLNKIDNPIDHSIQKLIKLKKAANNPKQFEQAVNVLEDWKKQGATVDLGGNLYKVDIPDEHIPHMLDWDKPLAQMTEKESSVLSPILDRLIASKNPYHPEEGFKTVGDVIQFGRGQNLNLEKDLAKEGFTGIRYLDEGSRTTGGTSNFVVFDPSTVKILEKNGVPTRKEIISKALEDK